MTQIDIKTLIDAQRRIIDNATEQLRRYDYIGTKIAMGVAAKKDYADEIAQTEQLRARINAAQEEIGRLLAIEPEEDIANDDLPTEE